MLSFLDTQTSGSKIIYLSARQISPNPFQPRKNFDENEIIELCDSIKLFGLICPISVRKTQRGYELIAGERRLRACTMASLEKIPCVLIPAEDKQSALMAISENLQRSDLNFFEEADAILALIREHSMTIEQISAKIGRSTSYINAKTKLTNAPQSVRETAIKNNLTENHVKSLLLLEKEELQTEALRVVVLRNLNASQTRVLVEKLLRDRKDKRVISSVVIKDLRILTNTVNKAVDQIRKTGMSTFSTREEFADKIIYTITVNKGKTSVKQTQQEENILCV